MNIRKIIYLLISIVLLITLDLWKNYSDVAESFFNSYIAPIYDDYKLPLIYTLWSIIGLIVIYQSIVGNLKEESKNEMELLIKANQQLSSYRRRDMLESLMQRLVSTQPSVHSVQLYRYTQKKYTSEVVYKIELVSGHVHEQLELNAMQQSYFKVHRDIYREFKRAKRKLDGGDPYPLISYIERNSNHLSNLSEITDHHAMVFSLIQLSTDLLEKYLGRTLVLTSPSEELQQQLLRRKRTGILRAILLGDQFYTFTYLGSGEKHGRLYVARHIELWGVNHCFLLTIDPSILEEENAENSIVTIQEVFNDELNNTFRLV